MPDDVIQTQIIELMKKQAAHDAERGQLLAEIEDMKADIKTTKALAEDVHILAINMETMRTTLDETCIKVAQLKEKDYNNYKENRKLIKSSVFSLIVGAIIGGGLNIIQFIVKEYLTK